MPPAKKTNKQNRRRLLISAPSAFHYTGNRRAKQELPIWSFSFRGLFALGSDLALLSTLSGCGVCPFVV